MVFAWTANGSLRWTRTARWRLPGEVPWNATDPWCRFRPKRRPAASEIPASTASAGTGGNSTRRGSAGRAAAAALRRGGLPRPRLGERGRGGGPSRRRLHAVLRRYHRAPARGRAADGRGARRRTTPPTSPSRAANRTGNSIRTPSGIRAPPGSGRPSGWSECPPPTSEYLRWTPNVERWEIGFEAWLGGERREGLRLNVRLPPTRRCWRTTPTRSWPARCTGASRSRTRASTITATNCCGAPPLPLSFTPS